MTGREALTAAKDWLFSHPPALWFLIGAVTGFLLRSLV